MSTSGQFANKPEVTPRIRFDYYTYLTSSIGGVFQYLLRSSSHSARDGKKMGLEAISAFWKPFSAKAVLELSDEEVKSIALDSIDRLQNQIALIRKTFDLHSDVNAATRRDIEKIVQDSLSAHYSAMEKRQPQTIRPLVDNYHLTR